MQSLVMRKQCMFVYSTYAKHGYTATMYVYSIYAKHGYTATMYVYSIYTAKLGYT